MQFYVKFEQKSVKPVQFCVILCDKTVILCNSWAKNNN